MATKVLITGDKHGQLDEFAPLLERDDLSQCAVIVLGDSGCNFFGRHYDRYYKYKLNEMGCRFYMVKGNHDKPIQEVKADIEIVYDEDVGGPVYIESEFPNIRYFLDYGVYMINGYTCGVIGGAYSVDKELRLAMHWPWFEHEQLSAEQMEDCAKLFDEFCFDFIFSHTCPINWQPTDLFLSSINQSKVDNTMERWMQKMVDEGLSYGAWVWAHYHVDRIERPHCEIYYNNFEDLDTIYERWKNYDMTGELSEWYLQKSPNFYMT